MLSVVMLNVMMLSVVMLNVVMLSVVAPMSHPAFRVRNLQDTLCLFRNVRVRITNDDLLRKPVGLQLPNLAFLCKNKKPLSPNL